MSSNQKQNTTSRKKRKRPEKGDCFERAFHLITNGSWNGQRPLVIIGRPMLVHGIVWHEETGYHVHGWVECDQFCHDFVDGQLCLVPKQDYYRIGRIKTGQGEIMRYDAEQAAELVLSSGYYYFSNLPCNQ